VQNKNNKKLKYGATSTIVIALVVAVFIIVNIIVTSLSVTFNIYTDLTTSNLYELTDEFKKELKNLVEPEGKDKVYLNIILMMDKDAFEAYSSYTMMVYKVIQQIVEKYDTIKLVTLDITKNPADARPFQINSTDAVFTTDVVIELTDENHTVVDPNSKKEFNNAFGTYKKYAITSFYSFTNSGSQTNVYGINAEVAILSAVARLVNYYEKPIAYLLQGHGEPVFDENGALETLLYNAGYEVKEINLALEDFPYEENEYANSDLLIINSPIYNLVVPTSEDESGMVSEVKKIRKFLSGNYGNLVVMENSSTPNYLYELEELLSEWGLGFGYTVTDDAHSVAGSGSVKVLADLDAVKNNNDSKYNFANSFMSRILTSNSTPISVINNPKSVIIKPDNTIVHPITSTKFTSQTLIPSYDTAEYVDEFGTRNTTRVALAGAAAIEWNVNDTNNTTSYVFCFGSNDFYTSDYEINQSIFYAMLSLINSNQYVSFEGISFKLFDKDALTVSTSDATTWTVLTMTIIPVIMIGLGVYVWIRRRHS
jgi:ABC-2 type transport system permease protein